MTNLFVNHVFLSRENPFLILNCVLFLLPLVHPFIMVLNAALGAAFCLLYKLFTLKLTRKQVNGLITHPDSPYIRALGFMYIRFTQPPADLWDWYEEYLEDPEELDVKAGGGQVMCIGDMLRHFLSKLDWFSTLFPRIPVPIQPLTMFTNFLQFCIVFCHHIYGEKIQFQRNLLKLLFYVTINKTAKPITVQNSAHQQLGNLRLNKLSSSSRDNNRSLDYFTPVMFVL
ncbi:hypothetical protein J437_LFUL006082 [Ladona fulva]|uniref:Pre-mRNA-splicing factor 38 n=1 Tax=Ladona fulva TaxID=123851 RepID=A0A8K0JXV2_LADFU|nr:hypothetical protein J437_LFUL006082 [Ladona fulva]